MKKNDKLTNNSWLQRLTLFVVSLICVLGSVQAGDSGTTYYYRVTATPTAGGRVYATDNQNDAISYAPENESSTNTGSITTYGGAAAYQTFYLYATPNDGYAFDGWRKTGTTTGAFESTSPEFSVQAQITSRDTEEWTRDIIGYRTNIFGQQVPIYSDWYTVDLRTQVSYTAYFHQVQAAVKVATTNAQRGYVTIDKADNVYGDVVTIRAYPNVSKGVLFLGWKKDNQGDFISTENPYSLTVSGETEGTYYAYFSDEATTAYCILKNAKTGNYLCFAGNKKATGHPGTFKDDDNKIYNIIDGYDFDGGLKTITPEAAVNNPMIVFKRSSTLSNGVRLGYLASDVWMKTDETSGAISTDVLVGDQTHRLTFSQSPKNPQAYRISTSYHSTINTSNGEGSADFVIYLYEGENGAVSMQPFANPYSEDGIDWEITFLTENQVAGAFGVKANPKSKSEEGKYYTSMYAPFAYKLLDGVKAYYLHPGEDVYDEVENKIHLTPVEGDIVPPNMAVILECNTANDATKNRLLPLAEYSIEQSVLDDYKKNVLLGYNHVVSRNGYTGENAIFDVVSNEEVPQYLYIFSIKNQALGFYHYSGKVIPENKAYLYIPVDWETISDGDFETKLNNVKLVFGFNSGDENLNSISLFDDVVDDIDLPIYNLQGVQVKNPEKGIYIRGGKKYLVK